MQHNTPRFRHHHNRHLLPFLPTTTTNQLPLELLHLWNPRTWKEDIWNQKSITTQTKKDNTTPRGRILNGNKINRATNNSTDKKEKAPIDNIQQNNTHNNPNIDINNKHNHINIRYIIFNCWVCLLNDIYSIWI